jgi:Transposase DDE domain group 1
MVIVKSKHTRRPPVLQGSEKVLSEPNKIAANTPFDFSGKNLTPYGGLLPVATMLEKLGFKKLVEETLHVHRIPRAMTIYQFLLGMVLALYVGFSRLSHLRFVAQDPMLTGVLQVGQLPPQSTFWRFLASLHSQVANQLLAVQRILRQRVWEAANVQLDTVTLDTDTTVHTLYGKQMGGRKSYNPKNRGKKSYQPILTFLAETREYVGGELHNGDRLTGRQIARHLENGFAALPKSVGTILARADAGFYCYDAVETYEKGKAWFIIVAQNGPIAGGAAKGSVESFAQHRCRRAVRVLVSARGLE